MTSVPQLRKEHSSISSLKNEHKKKLSRRVSMQFRKVVFGNEASEKSKGSEQLDTIFGQPLDEVLENYGGPIPPLLQQCTRRLRSDMKEEGIFRVSGMSTSIDLIGQMFADLNRETKPNLKEIECHAIAGAYKKFFRDLPQPIFTTSLYDDFIAAESSGDNSVKELQKVLARLPLPNYFIIKYVIKFLYKVSKHSEDNKMAPDNLGIVFGPTLLRSKEEVEQGAVDLFSQGPANVVTKMIEQYKDIFQKLDAPSIHMDTRAPIEKSESGPIRVRRARTNSCVDANFDFSNLKTEPESSQHSHVTPRRRRKTRGATSGKDKIKSPLTVQAAASEPMIVPT